MEENKITKLDNVTKSIEIKESDILRRKGKLPAKDIYTILQNASSVSGLAIFAGKVSHAYESDFTKQIKTCPRCGAPTQQMLSIFPYATQIMSRQITGSAGHFCTKCPTVIINDDIMKTAIAPPYLYGGVFAIMTLDSEIHHFKTLNGEVCLSLPDNVQSMLGISNTVHKLPPSDEFSVRPIVQFVDVPKIHTSVSAINKAASDKKRAKAKQVKQAKQARKQNKKK